MNEKSLYLKIKVEKLIIYKIVVIINIVKSIINRVNTLFLKRIDLRINFLSTSFNLKITRLKR